MQLPLTVHILYHSSYKEGKKVYSNLYKTLCRDSRNPFISGLDIPVYFHTDEEGKSLKTIPTDLSKKTFILLLVDQNMYLSKEWKVYVNDILLLQKNENVKIYAVSLYKYAFEFSSKLGSCQFFSFNNESILLHWNEFKLRLYDNLIRFIKDDKINQMRIFISHSKRDENSHGERLAKDLRNYLLQQGTKLSSFFDVNCIMEGTDFKSQILDSIESAIMIVIFSETYSSREWCIMEILQAKKNNRPVIVVFDIEGEIDRVFPYIGNIPATVYNNEWLPIINLLLRTSLNMTYQEQLLQAYPDTFHKMTSAPDAYSLSNMPKSESSYDILYPEPPLGYQELEILHKIKDEKMKFLTPMQYNVNGFDLKRRSIAISFSESEDQSSNGIGQDMLDDIVLEILRYILVANGKLVYGGNLQQNGYTERFRDLSLQYCNFKHITGEDADITNPEDERYMTSFIAWPFNLMINNDKLCEFQHCRVDVRFCEPYCSITPEERISGPQGSISEQKEKRAQALTLMREKMETDKFSDGTSEDKEILARIFIGGKTSSSYGLKPGILEEFELALKRKRPIFLLGGFGGETKRILDHINKVPGMSVEGLSNLEFEDLNNGIIDSNEKEVLSKSTNIIEIVPIVLSALHKLANK